MSFPKTTQFRDFVQHLHETYELKKIATMSSRNGPTLAITIDGIPAVAIKAVPKTTNNAHSPTETTSTTPTSTQSRSRSTKTSATMSADAVWSAPGHSDPVDLVHVMNRKMLLAAMVIICAIFNALVIGLMQLQYYDELRDGQAIWVFMLIVFDMLVAVLMMYLQFTYNHKTYWKLCSKVDLVLVKFALKLLKCCWIREHTHVRTTSPGSTSPTSTSSRSRQLSVQEALQQEIDNYANLEIKVKRTTAELVAGRKGSVRDHGVMVQQEEKP